MKTALAPLAFVTMLVVQSPAEARDGFGAAVIVSPTIAGLAASASGYSEADRHAGIAPAIYGYGYRVTYYGKGFIYQPAWSPAYAYYAAPRFRPCCRR
jgi:Na+(H+)/acetate symporter ActP